MAPIPGLDQEVVLPAHLVGGDPDNADKLLPLFEDVRLTILDLENRDLKVVSQIIKNKPTHRSRVSYVRGTTSVPSQDVGKMLRMCEVIATNIRERGNEAMAVPAPIAAWVAAQKKQP